MSETTVGSARAGQSSQGKGLVQQSSEVMGEGSQQLRKQIDQRTTQAGQELQSFADVLRRTGRDVQDETGVASPDRVASGVADRLERFGGYLESARSDDLLRDAERLARERPWVVAGAAAAVGFTISRLLKASSESRYDGRPESSDSLRQRSWSSDEDARDFQSSSATEPAALASGSRA